MKRPAPIIILAVMVTTGCSRASTLVIVGTSEPRGIALDEVLRRSPLGADQNIRVTDIWRDAAMSCHIVQIRDGEAPHLHADHDLTVTILRGSGELFVNGQPHSMRSGDSAIVPRQTPHHFVNRATEPAVAFVTFAPAHDGTDQVRLGTMPVR
jgi:mannose-6-phosphate isomerase-like protein (cupin superfamily)